MTFLTLHSFLQTIINSIFAWFNPISVKHFQLRRTFDIAVRAGNYAAAKMLLDARGGPVSAQMYIASTFVTQG